MPNSASRTLATFIAAMLAILAIIILAGIMGIAAVDVIRSYASGGTHYAKGHLTAVAALRRFAITGAEEDFYRYRYSIHVPMSDRIAREILEDPDVDLRNSYPFLIAGKNHHDDVAGIAWMFRTMGDTTLFQSPIEIWRRADTEVQYIDAIADRLYKARRGEPVDGASIAYLLRQLDAIDTRLGQYEDQFALHLGDAARSLALMLYGGLVAFGLALAALVVALGIRTRHRLVAAQEAIRQREERFRDVAEVAADWIWETDAELRFSYFSDRVEEAIGVPKSVFLGRTRADIAHIEDTESWQRHLADIAGRRPFLGFEYAFRHPNGGISFFRLNGKPVFDAAGRFLGYRGTGSDVTEEVTARRQVAEKTALLETIFETMTQGISVVDEHLNMAAFNRRFLDLMDFPADRFQRGDPYSAFVRFDAERGAYGDGAVDDIVVNALAGARHVTQGTSERVRPNGTILEVTDHPLPGGGFVTTYTDVSERRRAARSLQSAMVAAETANHAKSAFLANMSHELRTPLNAVIGFADLMAEERFGPLGQRYAGYARDIRHSGEHLLAVINDILDITRVEAGKIQLTIEPVSPHNVVDDCFRMIRKRALEAGVKLHNEIPMDAPPIPADPQRLRQVILNLAGNAIKFSPSGSDVTVHFLDDERGRGLEIVDHGIGIPEHQIAEAFEPFAQVHAGFDRNYEGAGLGLPLVRRFMELHGGSVEIRSEINAGTTVAVRFPISADTEAGDPEVVARTAATG